jgi:L-lactate dehydrogenase complex protein LldG
METMNSRKTIRNAIRYNLPQQCLEHPGIPDFALTGGPLTAAFGRRLEDAGGATHDVDIAEEAHAKLRELAESVSDPHDLADMDIGIVRTRLAVVEGGAVWLTQEDLVVDALGFLSQHLIVWFCCK